MVDLVKVESNLNMFDEYILSKLDVEIKELKEKSANTQLDRAYSKFLKR